MSAAALVGAARAAGVELRLVGGTVKVRGTATAAMREALREARADIAALLALPPWTDLDAWCARIGATNGVESRRIILCQWADSAGGWHDPVAVHLPRALPDGLAKATLRAHARMLDMVAYDDPDSPELMQWLRTTP